MRVINKKCIVCGKEYSYCPNCSSHADKPTWFNEFDSENCKIIYEACAGYWMKHLTKKEAYNIIKDCDLSNKKDFTDSTKKLIDEIMELKPEKKPTAKTTKVEAKK